MSTEKIFAKGFSFKRNDKAPEFVIGSLSLKADDAIAFIKEHTKNGWVNLDVKKSKDGGMYVELNTYQRTTQSTNANEDIDGSLPF